MWLQDALKNFVATEILVFDFELFKGIRVPRVYRSNLKIVFHYLQGVK
jgi:hypothetical protein